MSRLFTGHSHRNFMLMFSRFLRLPIFVQSTALLNLRLLCIGFAKPVLTIGVRLYGVPRIHPNQVLPVKTMIATGSIQRTVKDYYPYSVIYASVVMLICRRIDILRHPSTGRGL